MNERSVRDVLNLYNPADPLEKAYTIPAPWYFDKRIEELERNSVFAANWQVVGRLDQVRERGEYFTIDVNGEPLIVVRSEDGILRAFYNVCRHHAAAVVPEEQGCAKQFRCPYHGWTYGNDGALKGMVEFDGVCNFNRADNGLVPVPLDSWENFIFVNLDGAARPLLEFLGKVPELVAPLKLSENLHYFDRRIYTLNCNWKVYVDNYLDGGYHVPHAHKGLSSVVEYTKYTIENFERVLPAVEPTGYLGRAGGLHQFHAAGPRLLFVGLSEFHDQRLLRRHGHQSGLASGRGQMRRDLRLLFRGHQQRGRKAPPRKYRRQ